MPESSQPLSILPTRTAGNLFPRNFGRENLPPFGRVCVALWGLDKPGMALATRIGKTERVANLYIAGSSVFPTAGANFATITIAALSLRLAQHLMQKLKAPGSRLVDELPDSVSASVEQEAIAASIGSAGLPAV